MAGKVSLPLGIEDFEEMRTKNAAFDDKCKEALGKIKDRND